MAAMAASIQWLGKEVPKGESPKGSGNYGVPFLDRAAGPVKGRAVYARQCLTCHMEDGLGMPKPDNTA